MSNFGVKNLRSYWGIEVVKGGHEFLHVKFVDFNTKLTHALICILTICQKNEFGIPLSEIYVCGIPIECIYVAEEMLFRLELNRLEDIQGGIGDELF